MNYFNSLIDPITYFFDPTKRIFFLYLVVALGLSVFVFMRDGKKLEHILPELFSDRIWFHRSSLIDFQLMFLNGILRAFGILAPFSALFFTTYIVQFLYWLDPSHYRVFLLSQTQGLLLFTLASFVLLDFARFFQHYLFHKVPFLWRFHKVHHSAEVMTPITLYRTHPIESLVSAVRRTLVLGLLAGFFKYYTQSLIDAYVILGVNILDFAFNIFGSNLRHSHVWLSFGPLNYIFVSPAQHQIHHSRAEKHVDKNLGFALSLWDILFGTFYQVGNREFLIFGVRGERYKNLKEALLAPIKS